MIVVLIGIALAFQITFRHVFKHRADDISALYQVMAWCSFGKGYNITQCWLISLKLYCHFGYSQKFDQNVAETLRWNKFLRRLFRP